MRGPATTVASVPAGCGDRYLAGRLRDIEHIGTRAHGDERMAEGRADGVVAGGGDVRIAGGIAIVSAPVSASWFPALMSVPAPLRPVMTHIGTRTGGHRASRRLSIPADPPRRRAWGPTTSAALLPLMTVPLRISIASGVPSSEENPCPRASPCRCHRRRRNRSRRHPAAGCSIARQIHRMSGVAPMRAVLPSATAISVWGVTVFRREFQCAAARQRKYTPAAAQRRWRR